MDEAVIQDLKQFIAAMFSQERHSLYTDLRRDIREDIRQDIKEAVHELDVKLSQKIDDMSAYIANAIDNSNDICGQERNNHHRRIAVLEAKAGM